MSPTPISRLTSWPVSCLILVGVGVALLALPARLEGPPVAELGIGHAVSSVDLLGVVPLLLGSACLHSGLWSRRKRLEAWVVERPRRAVAAFSMGGLGLGLLLASAFSRFFWWWAIGAGLFAAMHIPVVLAASRRRVRHDKAMEQVKRVENWE